MSPLVAAFAAFGSYEHEDLLIALLDHRLAQLESCLAMPLARPVDKAVNLA